MQFIPQFKRSQEFTGIMHIIWYFAIWLTYIQQSSTRLKEDNYHNWQPYLFHCRTAMLVVISKIQVWLTECLESKNKEYDYSHNSHRINKTGQAIARLAQTCPLSPINYCEGRPLWYLLTLVLGVEIRLDNIFSWLLDVCQVNDHVSRRCTRLFLFCCYSVG